MDRLAQRLKNLTPLQRAVLALKETQARLETLERSQAEPIAIVGMACRFPGGAADPQSYWQLLCDGVDAIRETPPGRWNVEQFYDPDPAAPGKMCTRWGGYLDDIDAFDNHFFGISDREAVWIDPQQRLLLELGWEALEDAGLPPLSLRGTKTGVFVGIAVSDYGIMLSTDIGQTESHAASGLSLCFAANRLSYLFALQGPSLAVDTACSSSLVAIHLACQNIRQGECEMALAGGSNLLLSPFGTVNLTKAGFCAPDGRVRAFDAEAAGYVRSEGAGIVVLKPLSAALKNRDPIYAVIRGSAVNQNGASNGLTAPSRAAQELVLREAYARAKVSPGQIQYVETQGTGTRLGDAIEAAALGTVLGADRASGSRCALGAVKTNIGHLETASGVASLMKAALALKHRQLPGNLHFQTPNPDISFDELPLRVLKKLEDWPHTAHPRLAGVSAFGFGGSNAHIVLEEAPLAESEEPPAWADDGAMPAFDAHNILPLSARTEKALRDLAGRYIELLGASPPAWRDLCYTAAVRRDHHDCRLAVLASTHSEAQRLLQHYLDGEAVSGLFSGRKPFGRNPSSGFVYDGRAEFWKSCGARLIRSLPGFAAALESVDEILARTLGWRLKPIFSESGDNGRRQPQVALLALQLALTAWWRNNGVTPDVVVGSGVGELAAACAAGILSAQEALHLAMTWDRSQTGSQTVPHIQTAALPFLSSMDGLSHSGPDLGADHWRECIRFPQKPEAALEALKNRSLDFLLVLGAEAAADGVGNSDALWPSVETLGHLYAAGAGLKWGHLAPANGRCVRLPAYPWQKQRLWARHSRWDTPSPAVPETGQPLQRSPRPDLITPYVAPQPGLETELAEIWEEILQVDSIGVHDNFFALGGHSLLATQVASRIAARVQADVPLREMFQSPTIAELVQRIESAGSDGLRANGPPITRVSRSGQMLPSLTQEALWFLDQLERGRATYTINAPVRVRGRLNAATVERALNEIIRRHEALRTRFPEVDGRPIQVIEPFQPRSFPLVDLSSLPEAQRESRFRELIAAEMERPIDLQKGPLIRVALLRLSESEHVAMVGAHHVIYDGWSMAVLLRELSALYTAFETGQPSPLMELAVQYADFAAWQRQSLQGERFERLRAYWVKQLANVAPLELPLDRLRPSIRTTRGDTLHFNLPQETGEALLNFCRQGGVTPFMTLLAAFNVLLQRYSGQDDIAVGSPVANRARPETEALIGYFVNVVVLRNDLSGDPSFREVLQRVRQVTLDAYDHQDITLDQVVAAVNPSRDMSRHPLFQVMFALHNIELPQLDSIGINLEVLQDGPAVRSSYFDLTLAFWQSGAVFRGELSFNTDLFEEETLHRMASHYEVLLNGAIAKPDCALSALPILSEEERQRLLAQGNAEASGNSENACIHDLFDSQARSSPDALALVDGLRSWTYRELNEHANRLAHCLQARGAGPDQIVAVRLPRSAEMIIAILGTLKAGAAYLPLDLQLPPDRLRFMLDDAEVKIVVTRDDLQSDLPATLPAVICVDRDQAELADFPLDAPECETTSENLAYVIYTSGSTGRPKGVMIEHRALVHYTQDAAAAYEITSADRVLQFASASFDAHAEEVYPCLTRGGTLVLRNEEMLECKRFLEQCDEWGITFLTLPTAYWHELVSAIAADRLTLPSRLRMVVLGGEAVLPERVALWFQCVDSRVRLMNTYGPAEATVIATAAELTPADLGATRLTIGQPLSHRRAYVLDRSRQLVPVGVHGELHLGGDGLARGYLKRPELTAERFLPDTFALRPGCRMYKTGDIVRWTRDGRLEFIGRADNQVKIRGFRIEPGEIEEVLSGHPSLAQAAVVPRPAAEGDLRLVAYVVGKTGSVPDLNEVRQFLAQSLPDYMIPSAFVALDALPTTTSGKIDRRALHSPDWSKSTSRGEFVAPRPGSEQQVAAIWSEVLKLDRVGADDNFFAVGGNSLLALRLVARIRAAFSVDLPLVTLFTAPTVSGLAAIVEKIRAEPHAELETSSEPIDWDLETQLDPAIRATADLQPPEAAPSRILLTGATGFLGAYLLRELLQQTNADVYCLVRARSIDEARKRIADNLRQYELQVPALDERVIPVCGELAEPRLGLSSDDFDALAATIDAIFHNGAYVNFVYPYQVLKPANVAGTIEVLRLATQTRLKPLHFVSTISVFEAPQYQLIGPIAEDQPLEALASLQGGYAQSKCVAEKLVREASARGLPVAIYRPGRVTADSETGAESLADYTTLLLRLCIDMKLAPALYDSVDMTPVDYVARAVVGLARRPESLGETFHVINPRPVPLRDVYQAIRACGYELQEAPLEAWGSSAIQWGTRSKDASFSTLAHWLMLMAPHTAAARSGSANLQPMTFACDQTQKALQAVGLSCPELDLARLKKQVFFLVRKKLCAPPPQPVVAKLQSLVPLRAEGSERPFFCIHGLGGHIVALLPLAQKLPSGRPVYGLQALGLESGQEPQDRIEGMAASYLREIRSVQPEGPYLLGGWSMGGLIALEAAHQLFSIGQKVALVTLIDSYVSVQDFQNDVHDQSVILRIASQLNVPVAELKDLPLSQQWDRIAELANRASGVGVDDIRQLAAACRAHLRALAGYQILPYAGPCVLFPAASGRSSLDRGWKRINPQLCIEPAPGDHYSMLRDPHVASLADHLDRCLRKFEGNERVSHS